MLERPARRKGIANLARKVTLSEIRIGKRYRREMGDIGKLAASMEELGLLQPIVVTPDGTLIAGERRSRGGFAARFDPYLHQRGGYRRDCARRVC
jgi:hypothetical protein